MHLLHALERFTRRPVEARADALDCDVKLFGADAWPEAATAAVMLAGYLDDALTDADLDEALAHLQTLHSAGVVDDDQWKATIDEVISARISDLEEQGAFDNESSPDRPVIGLDFKRVEAGPMDGDE